MNESFARATNPERLSNAERKQRQVTGQVFTPPYLAEEIASTITVRANSEGRLHVLDPGIGYGQLTMSLLERIASVEPDHRPAKILVTGIEADARLADEARSNLERLEPWCRQHDMKLQIAIVLSDFLWPRRWKSHQQNAHAHIPVDVCIVNPPYRRINSKDAETAAITRQALEYTGNVYTAFCELACRALRPNGQLAALTPRSFQNGKRFAGFRRRLRQAVDVDTVHVWQNRHTLFGVQRVIQETVCWHGYVKTAGDGDRAQLVIVTHGDHERHCSSRWTTAADQKWRSDPNLRLTTHRDRNNEVLAKWAGTLPTIEDLGLHVETGRHIKSRDRATLAEAHQAGAVRYYGIEHIGDGELNWPITGNPNWHLPCENGHRSLRVSPPGQYLLANRFAPNDREPRASACVFTEAETTEGFVASDRTNVIRTNGPAGRTLDHETVLGIATWINSAVANNLIGALLGSTQLNANDLTNLPVPAVADLRLLAKRRSPGAAGEIEISKLLKHAIDDETRKAARTIKRLDRVRRRMREAAPRRLDLHEDTTALALMALTDHESVAAEDAGPAIVTLIKLRFGRHLEERAARHVDELAVPWILRTGIAVLDAEQRRLKAADSLDKLTR